MKLLRYGPVDEERPGLLDGDGQVRSLDGVIDDVAGSALSSAALERVASIDPSTLPRVTDGVRLGPCVGSVGKLVGIGLNYADHAAETGAEPPAEPLVFMKATSSICGPADDLEIPRGSLKSDWEVELGVVIGATAKYVDVADAMACVAGFCVLCDVSERAFQKERGGQFVKGKSHDTFGPLGPWLVTRDEVPDPQALELWLEVDGRRMQHASTRDMVFPVAKLVSYLSGFMTLHPGDVIATGTPSGVGAGMSPPQYLRAGQNVRLSVEGLGTQEHRTIDA